MARTDTLPHFLTDVADAIREKTGSQASIQASSFDTAISNISGGGSTIKPAMINFQGLSDEEIDVSGIDTSAMYDMASMFQGCEYITSLDISNFDTSNVGNMYGMFANCYSLETIEFGNIDVSNVTDAGQMFYSCNTMTSLDLSNLTFSSLVQATEMFAYMDALEFLDIRGIDLTNLSEYSNMFDAIGSPETCLIVVADSTQKDWMNTNFPDFENVQTVAEYEAE